MKEKITFVFQNAGGIPMEVARFCGGPLLKGTFFCVRNFRVEAAGGAGDVFSYEIRARGCRILRGAVILREEDVQRKKKVIPYSLDKHSGRNCEPWILCRWTPEVETHCFSEEAYLQVDAGVGTPYFVENRGKHCFTDLRDAERFLGALCRTQQTAQFYSAEMTGCFPAVIFTKKKIARLGFDAALDRLASGTGTKVLYQAQIHGNEPAAGEGALAVAEVLVQPAQQYLLDALDVVILPRVNVQGGEVFTRGENEVNLNRDGILLRSETTRRLHQVFNRLRPEILIDGHEFDGQKRQAVETETGWILDSLDDIKITCVDHLNRGSGIFPREEQMMLHTIDSLRRKGFRSFYFPGSFAANTSCGYARLMHCFAFLVESCGIRRGGICFRRRVMAQREAVLDLLSQAADCGGEIREAVAVARRERYSSFAAEQQVKKGCGPARPCRAFDFFGHVTGGADRQAVIENRGEAVRTEPVPYAFFLKKEEPDAGTAAELLQRNGACCTCCEDGWLFETGQLAGGILCASLSENLGNVEPQDGSLIQAGVIRKEAVCRLMKEGEKPEL